jgi:N-acyl-D-amino-acid deacylase
MLRLLPLTLLFSLTLQAATTDQIRAAATRSIALLQKGSAAFYKTQDCFSCHHQALPAQTYRAARLRGVPVDENAFREVAIKALTRRQGMGSIDEAVQDTSLIDPNNESWGLVSADASGVRPNLITAAIARRLANWQRPEGYWFTGDERPPQSHSQFTATAIAIRAVQLYIPEELRKEASERAVKAKTWMLNTHPASTEDYTYRLLGLHWAGATTAEKEPAMRELAALQRPDGGWAQLPRMQSDAYATGEALVALKEAGSLNPKDPAFTKGIDFLLKSQAADGSWHVATRMVSPAHVSPPYFETGFPYGKDQFLSTMATAVAASALLEALPVTQRVGAPALDLGMTGEQPWMRAALFGTAAELKNLLDHGLNPNSKTAEGTTVLMMAAPDPVKVGLLLSRGAEANAKSKSGYTALMTASLYRGTKRSLELLLEKGAAAVPGTGVKNNASPLFLAAYAGDVDNIALLKSKGADPNRKMVLLGIFPASALLNASVFGEVPVMKALIAAGANVREHDDDGMGPLHWAALANHVDAVRTLIAAGAPVNEVDKWGYTPLLYASTVDFGGSAMVKTLLEAGADRRVRTKEGKTPLEQAKAYGYPEIRAVLEK